MGRAGLIVALVTWSLAGCLDRVDVGALRYRCVSDADCRPGRFCDPVARACVAALPDVTVVEPDDVVEGGPEAGPEPAQAEPEPEPAREPAFEVQDGEPVEAVCEEGAPCDDGDPCTVDDICSAGRCGGRVPVDDAICDGRDDDCDGVPDDDYASEPLSCGLGACAATGATACVAGHVLMECHPGAPSDEICNGVDDDCDGRTDAADISDVPACDGDGDGYCAGVGPDPGPAVCPHGLGDCDDDRAWAHPGGVEACDGAEVDEDCNGFANEDAREAASAAWPGVTEPGWGLVAGVEGWHLLVGEGEAWLGTSDDADFYRASMSFPTVSATVVQVRAGPFDDGVTRRVCLFVGTPAGAPPVACQGLAFDEAAPDPSSTGCCREIEGGGMLDVAAAVNLAGEQQATLVVLVSADGGTCDAYRIEIATAQDL